MNAVKGLNNLKVPFAFAGKFAIKLHGAHLLGTRATPSSVPRVEVAIQKKDLDTVDNMLVRKLKYEFITLKSSRKLLVYEKKGKAKIILHLYDDDKFPKHMTYNNNRTRIVSLSELPKNNAKVKRMTAFINSIKRIGSLN